MTLLDRWNRFALKKIHINDRVEISAGRLVFGTIIFLIAEFTTFPVAWIFILFGVKIHKKNHDDKKEKEDKVMSEEENGI